MAQLEINDVTLRFGGITALSNVTFDVERGHIHALIGPNGAGKTSLFNVISGIYRPTSGQALFEGHVLNKMKPHRIAGLGVARTFQNIELFQHMTVIDNLLLGRHLHMRTGILAGALFYGRALREETAHRLKVEEIIDFLEIEHIRKTPVGRLPYGLQKRVELGRALAAQPELLLLDEPMAGMNLGEKEDMSRFILDVNDEFGTTIVLIEHDMGVVMDISDHVVVLDYGRKLADGPPDEVRANQEVIDAYLGVSHD